MLRCERSSANAKGSEPAVPISACMIVRDEEKLLDRCLDSFAAAFDELIVVDTGSKDGT